MDDDTDSDDYTSPIHRDHEEKKSVPRTSGAVYRSSDHSSWGPETRHERSWRNDGEARGVYGGQSYGNNLTWNRSSAHTSAPTGSWRNIGKEASGGARPKDCNTSWRRNYGEKEGDHNTQINRQEPRIPQRRADSQGAQPSDTTKSPITRDFFRRPGKTSDNSESKTPIPTSPPNPGEETKLWRRGGSDIRSDLGKYTGQVQVRQNPETPPMSEEELKTLLKESPQQVLARLLSRKDEWLALLNQDSLNDNEMILALRVLSCICDLTVDSNVKQDVHMAFSMIESSGFLSKHLTRYLVDVSTQQPHDPDSDGSETLANNTKLILKLLQVFLVHKPEFYGEVCGVLILLEAVVSLVESDCAELDPKGNSCMLQILQLKECYHSLHEARQKKQQIKVQQPPNNFRDIPIVPDGPEIRTPTKPFLRKNIIKGRYQDVEHYLDVQFRLLREDFVAPLREGVIGYLSDSSSRLQGIRIYHEVYIHKENLGKNGFEYTLKFNAQGFRRNRWNKSLIYGSFVCLTIDHFKNILCATVENRSLKDLEVGLVDVRFLTQDAIKYKGPFLMVESTAYYEAYCHILEGLQLINAGNFFFKKYIVDVSSNVDSPEYIRGDEGDLYDLRTLIVGTDQNVITFSMTDSLMRATSVSILDHWSWPPARDMRLDRSQKTALQAALTKEFAVIQGPPGTGKTYIGLKIVQVLLYNQHAKLPILVVCFTNHALDQFLEGIISTGEENVVRVGGRSASELLESKNLSQLRRKRTKYDWDDIDQAKLSLYHTEKAIQSTLVKNDLAKTTILNIETLRMHMGKHYPKFFRNDNDPTMNLLMWLHIVDDEKDENASPLADSGDRGESDKRIDVDDEGSRVQQERQLDDDYESRAFHDSYKRLQSEVHKENAAYSPGSKKRCGEHLNSTPEVELQNHHLMSDEEESRIGNVTSLTLVDRWRLYKLWVKRFTNEQEQELTRHRMEYKQLSEKLQYVEAGQDIYTLRKARVIGMTTTGAAKYRHTLQLLGPRIVIVEEAAEVLEAHIITSLTAKCQHLILIGDHQQLKPNPTVYRLAKVFNLDTSLFERMINNGVPYQTLTNQHRMRPEISKIMKEHFYENLRDDKSVMYMKNIKGVQHNVFFIDHQQLEDSGDDNTTKSNQFEAEFLVELCRYLMCQGYKSTQITILTMYVGQLFCLQELMDKDTFEGVRVCSVDNFQGEENDIILLSLVRSNDGGNIGFLKTSNRVCVALSRARMGLYCIGNASILKKTSIWNDIISTLQDENKIFSSIPLICQNHAVVTRVASARDFKEKVQDGGCGKPCGYRLPCDHICHLQCHPFDLNHAKYKCTEPCEYLCDREEHACPLKCYEKCRPCSTNVAKAMPDCGHVIQVKCHQFDSITCTEPCPQTLPCGHLCGELCGESCTTKCTVKVSKHVTTCGHDVLMECSSNPDLVPCTHPCDEILSCGHRCPKSCGQTCPRERMDDAEMKRHARRIRANFTAFCLEKCERLLPCGHPCPNKCGEPCPKESVYLSSLKGMLSIRCEKITHVKLPKCGHTVAVPCYTDIASITCEEICNKELSCGHRCTGKCGTPCKCKMRANRKLPFCRHSARLPCYQDVYSYKCGKKCEKMLPCGHQCSNKCWEPCPTDREATPSESPFDSPVKTCQRSVRKKFSGCNHSVVLPCSQDVESIVCPKKCTKILSCGHKCPNRCGEPCPRSFLRLEEKYTDWSDDSDSSSDQDELYVRKCNQNVNKKIPSCGHIVESPCYKRVESLVCQKPCEKTLTCGHQCMNKCGEPCPSEEFTPSDEDEEVNGNDFDKLKCQVIVKKQLPVCWHFINLPCYRKADSAECPKPCEKMLKCGHQCPNKCGEICISPEDCDELVETILPGCGHKVETHCSGDVKLVICTETCEKVLPCGHACPNKCKEPCPGEGINATTESRFSTILRRPTVKCDETDDKDLPCGHDINILGWQMPGSTSAITDCQEPCGHTLGCGHKCPGTCGYCGRLGKEHKICDKKCENLLLCGHRCSESCGHDVCSPHDVCLPHRRRNQLLGAVSRQPKSSKCVHQNTRVKIQTTACNFPCIEKLLCNHFCIGVCGEPCPPVCRFCDKKDVAKKYPEGPVRLKETFIYLEDCEHLCETRFLDEMFAALHPSTTGCVEIRPALCPKCKTPIRKCGRYIDILQTIKESVALARKQCEESHGDARLSFAVGGWMRCPEGHVFCQDDAPDDSEDGVPCPDCTSIRRLVYSSNDMEMWNTSGRVNSIV